MIVGGSHTSAVIFQLYLSYPVGSKICEFEKFVSDITDASFFHPGYNLSYSLSLTFMTRSHQDALNISCRLKNITLLLTLLANLQNQTMG